MRTITRQKFTATLYDADVYLQERMLIDFVKTDGSDTIVALKEATSSATGNTIAEYRLDSSGRVTIDVTDYLRAFQPQYLAISFEDNAAIFIQSYAGNINPNGVLRPLCNGLIGDSELSIMPPNKAIQGGTLNRIVLFIDAHSQYREYRWRRRTATGYGSYYNLSTGKNAIQVDETTLEINFERNTNPFSPSWVQFAVTDFAPQSECERYVQLSWIDRYTGLFKTAVWQRLKDTSETSDSVSLENIRNEYTVIKGFEKSFVARLHDLSMYDYWYYSDIITSSEVRLYNNDGTYETVNVTTKSETIPDTDSGKPNDLEIEIKYKRYDAI